MPDTPKLVMRGMSPDRRPVSFFIIVSVLALLSGGLLLRRGAASTGGVYAKAQMLDSVITLISSFYVDTMTAGQLYDLATDGMLRNLDDPYTAFLYPTDVRDHLRTSRGDYVGIGVRVELSDGWLTIVTPLSDSPAEEAGIEPGDRIIEVDGESTRGWSLDRASSVLSGDSGAAVDLTIARASMRQAMPFTLLRTRIHVASVRHSQLIEPGIGYVQLETVSLQSSREVRAAVDALRADGARRLVLDLRFNPGGLLDEGVLVSDLFLDEGDVVVETRGRAAFQTRTLKASNPEVWNGMPVVVLVNEFSASAAELIAGALQDHDRAVVLGAPTFGKGLVQTVLQVNRSEALRLTTSRWYTPLGRSIHRDRRSGDVPGDGGGVPDAEGDEEQGGIRPDIVAQGDSVTAAERRFQRALGSNIQTFRDVVAGLAIEISEGAPPVDPGQVVATASTRRELLRRLRAGGVTMPTVVWDGARERVERELRRRVLRLVFGREAEMRDQIERDAVVRRAVELLDQVETQAELQSLVGVQQGN